ncbi:MAG: hypothetical protein JNG85_02790 [Spirochaetaceae bacterium]|nr:hypothetical protein [Spirochaetaceae bacterium]
MKARTLIRFALPGLALCAAASCAGFVYSSTGRSWVVRAGETIDSDAIRARRAVAFQASGSLDAGSVTASILRDGVVTGPPVSIRAGSVDEKVAFAFEPGLWSFRAEADGEARGELFLSISDR